MEAVKLSSIANLWRIAYQRHGTRFHCGDVLDRDMPLFLDPFPEIVNEVRFASGALDARR